MAVCVADPGALPPTRWHGARESSFHCQEAAQQLHKAISAVWEGSYSALGSQEKKHTHQKEKQFELTFQNALRFVAMSSPLWSHRYPSRVSTGGAALEPGVIPTVLLFYFFGCANVGRLENKLWRILEERLQTAPGGMTNPIAAESNGALKIAPFLTINTIKLLADNKQPQKSQARGEVHWKRGWGVGRSQQEGRGGGLGGWEGCGCHMVHSFTLRVVEMPISALGLFQLRAARGAGDAGGWHGSEPWFAAPCEQPHQLASGFGGRKKSCRATRCCTASLCCGRAGGVPPPHRTPNPPARMGPSPP